MLTDLTALFREWTIFLTWFVLFSAVLYVAIGLVVSSAMDIIRSIKGK